MSQCIVTTQAELDKALTEKADWIDIRSPSGVWLEISASGSATVRASGSATVRASGSATVSAFDSATVSAYGSATVSASSLVAVHLHSASVHVSGGVVLDHTKVANFTALEWCEYNGVIVENGVATLYKAVNNEFTTDRGTDYSPGSLPLLR
jgi:cytoskeletal protein RodZ